MLGVKQQKLEREETGAERGAVPRIFGITLFQLILRFITEI
jgi:hypothetical protein